MSRAFVRETDDLDTVEQLPDRPVSAHRNLVTMRGLWQIEEALEKAKTALAESQRLKDTLLAATALRDLRYWSARHASAEYVPPREATDTVRFGSCVTLQDASGARRRYCIVGEDEADPSAGQISHISPIARALTGKHVGDVITLASGQWEIQEICASPGE